MHKGKENMSDFAIGDCAVYYGRGVGIVVGQEGKDPRGTPCKIFVLQLEKSIARVRSDNPETSTIRPVITKELLDEVYETLSDRSTKPSQTTWNRRYREYVQKIQSGEPLEVATVLRDLELLSIRKSLSFGESKIYTQARNLVIEEGAYVEIENTLVSFQKKLQAISKKLSKSDDYLRDTFCSFFSAYRDQYVLFIEKIQKIQNELLSDEMNLKIGASELTRAVKDLESMGLSTYLPTDDKEELSKKLYELEVTLLNIELLCVRTQLIYPVELKKIDFVEEHSFLLENLEAATKDPTLKQAVALYLNIIENTEVPSSSIDLDVLVKLFRLKSVQTKEKIDLKIKELFQKERDEVELERKEQESKQKKRGSAKAAAKEAAKAAAKEAAALAAAAKEAAANEGNPEVASETSAEVPSNPEVASETSAEVPSNPEVATETSAEVPSND
jgi:CarD family transcriptional regulator